MPTRDPTRIIRSPLFPSTPCSNTTNRPLSCRPPVDLPPSLRRLHPSLGPQRRTMCSSLSAVGNSSRHFGRYHGEWGALAPSPLPKTHVNPFTNAHHRPTPALLAAIAWLPDAVPVGRVLRLPERQPQVLAEGQEGREGEGIRRRMRSADCDGMKPLGQRPESVGMGGMEGCVAELFRGLDSPGASLSLSFSAPASPSLGFFDLCLPASVYPSIRHSSRAAQPPPPP